MIGTGAGAAAGQPHGTHVAGIVLGNRAAGSPRKGVANQAKLIPINIFGSEDGTSNSTIQRAFEHVEDLVIAAPALNIAAINMSVGGGLASDNCDDDPAMVLLAPVIGRLRNRNVASVISAGNDFSIEKMGFPACLSSMISVAATSKSGGVASYTNISRTTDVFAPGGDTRDCVVSSVLNSGFDAFCGTSMAAPHVAGAIAVLKQKVPAANHCRIENALVQTGIATADVLFTKPRIRVDAALNLLLNPVAPANDSFARAGLIPATTIEASFFGSNLDATLEAGEPHHVVAASADSVWYRWQPLTAGPVTIDTIGSGSNTVLAVYRGSSVAALGTPVAQNDNIGATNLASRVSFNAVAGTIYRIAVAGVGSKPESTLQLNMTRPPPPPPNDNFINATNVALTAGVDKTVTGNNTNATRETAEPLLIGSVNHSTSVWWKATAPATASWTIETVGSGLADTVLGVYTGNSVAALTLVAENDDSAGGLKSTVTFAATAGTVYRIVVAGFVGSSGPITLNFHP